MNKNLFLFLLLIFTLPITIGCSKANEEASVNEARELYLESIATNENHKRIYLRKKILSLAPDSAYGYFSEAWFNERNSIGSQKKIVKLLDKAIKLDPTMAVAHYNRAIAYRALGNFDKAFEDYARTIELMPEYRSAYINRGVMYQDLGDHSGAVDDFSEAIRLDSAYAKSYFNRGVSYYHLKKYKRAIKDFEKTLKLVPEYYGAAEYLQIAQKNNN